MEEGGAVRSKHRRPKQVRRKMGRLAGLAGLAGSKSVWVLGAPMAFNVFLLSCLACEMEACSCLLQP